MYRSSFFPRSISGQCIPIKQFSYETSRKSLKKNNYSRYENGKSIPIKIVMQKMSSTNLQQQIPSNQNNITQENKKFQHNQMLKIKFQKTHVFDRYNYENYENYHYKDPKNPSKYFEQKKIITKQKKKEINKGTNKNLEIIFCETKYKDFVDKVNKKLIPIYNTKHKQKIPDIKYLKTDKRKDLQIIKNNSILQINEQQQQINNINNYQFNNYNSKYKNKNNNFILKNNKNNKTTLSSYLHQFNILEKLSLFMQKQQHLNQRFLFYSIKEKDPSKNVLLDVITHRFLFLKQMRKITRINIYKSFLGLQQVSSLTKINIHDYLRFIKLFICRDADLKDIGIFIFGYLFQESKQISFKQAKRMLHQLPGSTVMHMKLQNILQQILNQSSMTEQMVFQSICKHQELLHGFIDLITIRSK